MESVGLVLQTLFLSVVITTADNPTGSAVQHGRNALKAMSLIGTVRAIRT